MMFTATFGVVAGYGDHTGTPDHREAFVARCVSDAVEKVWRDTGLSVGCVVAQARCFYPSRFGCPPQGESVITVSGVHNPQFGESGPWHTAATMLVSRLKSALKQERVTLTFSPCETVYLEAVPSKERPE